MLSMEAILAMFAITHRYCGVDWTHSWIEAGSFCELQQSILPAVMQGIRFFESHKLQPLPTKLALVLETSMWPGEWGPKRTFVISRHIEKKIPPMPELQIPSLIKCIYR